MAYDHNRPAGTRNNKNIARDIAVDCEGLTARKVALFVTVPGLPDVKAAWKAKLINRQTKIIAVNHCRVDRNTPYNAKIADQIKQDLTQMGLKHVLVNEFIESVRGIEKIQDAVAKFGKIDYAFIDICGLATPSFCSALNELQGSLAKKARIALTICLRVRRPQLINQWRDAFYGELESPALQILSSPISGEWLAEQFGNINGTRADAAAIEMQKKHISNFLWQFQAVVASFDRYVTRVRSALPYKDRTSMGLVVFDVIHQSSGHQLFHYISNMCNKAKLPISKGDRSLTSGKRAWITRRKNLRLSQVA